MTGFHHDTVDCFKECLVQIVLFQKPPELEERRCIRSIFLKEINPHEFAHGKTKREEFLEIMDEIIPWEEWVAYIAPYDPSGKRGRPPIWCISGSRFFSAFLVELGALMIVASTIVPPLMI